LDPIFFGDYPASMRTSIGSALPTFTDEEANLIKGSQDFVGINYYYSMYATFNDSDGKIIITGTRYKEIIYTLYASKRIFLFSTY